MRKDAGHDEYDLFFVELPTDLDPLSGLSTDIHDDHDTASNYDDIQGLSAEQVSRIARDLLQNNELPNEAPSAEQVKGDLFSQEADTDEV